VADKSSEAQEGYPGEADGLADERKSLSERLAESTKQFSLIIIHLFISVIAFIAAAIYVRFLLDQKPPAVSLDILPSEGRAADLYLVFQTINLIVSVFATYFPLVISIWVGLKFAGRANALMRAAFYEQTSVVPQKDFNLVRAAIQKGDPGPITEYIRLVSLTGGAGIFQKIGLTGLPLVTLGLVVFFASGVMFFSGDEKTFNAFLDFTKLTLGAFIGSFVQRQVENRSRETELQRAVENIARSSGTGLPGPRSTPEGTPPPAGSGVPEPPATPEGTPPPASGVVPVPPATPKATSPPASVVIPVPAATSKATPPPASGVVPVPPATPEGAPSADSAVVPKPPDASEGAPSADGAVVPKPPAASEGAPSADSAVVPKPPAVSEGAPSADSAVVPKPPATPEAPIAGRRPRDSR
jgi:hypothetical protein